MIKDLIGGIMGKELRPVDKICPILSVGMPEPIKCKGKECSWYHGQSDNEGKCAVSDLPGWMADLIGLIKDRSDKG